MAIEQTGRAKRVTHTYTYTVEGEENLPAGYGRKRRFQPTEMTVTVTNGKAAVEAVVRGPRVLKAGLSEHETQYQVYGDYSTASAPQWVRDAISACVADAKADQ